MLPHLKAMVIFIEKKQNKKFETPNNQKQENVILKLHHFSIFFETISGIGQKRGKNWFLFLPLFCSNFEPFCYVMKSVLLRREHNGLHVITPKITYPTLYVHERICRGNLHRVWVEGREGSRCSFYFLGASAYNAYNGYKKKSFFSLGIQFLFWIQIINNLEELSTWWK